MKNWNPLSTKREEEFFHAVTTSPFSNVNAETIDRHFKSLIKKRIAQGVVGTVIGLGVRFALKHKWPQYF